MDDGHTSEVTAAYLVESISPDKKNPLHRDAAAATDVSRAGARTVLLIRSVKRRTRAQFSIESD